MNIREVARKANVSTATVSRTINGSDKVSPETAERVRLAIAALNYYPNTNARALGSGRSRLFGLIISDITNPFFPDLVKSFEDVAVTHGQDVIVANTGYSSERTELCVQRMLERKVDGVAIMTSEMDSHLIDRLNSRNIPIVFLDTGTVAKGVSNILVDYASGIGAVVEHLSSLGHERIAYISGPMILPSARIRRDAFLESAKKHGIQLRPEWVQEANHRPDGGRAAMAHILESTPYPTAVVASNDLTAIGAIGAIHQHGLRVPGRYFRGWIRRHRSLLVSPSHAHHCAAIAAGNCRTRLSCAVSRRSQRRTGRGRIQDQAATRGAGQHHDRILNAMRITAKVSRIRCVYLRNSRKKRRGHQWSYPAAAGIPNRGGNVISVAGQARDSTPAR